MALQEQVPKLIEPLDQLLKLLDEEIKVRENLILMNSS